MFKNKDNKETQNEGDKVKIGAYACEFIEHKYKDDYLLFDSYNDNIETLNISCNKIKEISSKILKFKGNVKNLFLFQVIKL